jgi:endoglucanase
LKPGVAEASRIGILVGGKYRIVRLLAQGGMGVVFEAQHTVVRRRFAIKFLRRDLADRRDILMRFQHEAEAAGALENEHVAACVDFGISDDGTPYIVMEYLTGEDLASLLERAGRLPFGRAADLVCQAGRGVGAAHAAGIVHRDLKPQNLFVTRREEGTDLIKILDFGVAKLQAIDQSTAETGTGTVLGTAAYMAPEQARGEKVVDRRADVYALGAILYELVSQRKPHPGDSQNAILHHIATHAAVPLGSLQPDLPSDLVAVVMRALAADPAQRPPTADALAKELAPFARREVWPAAPDESAASRVEIATTLLTPGDDARSTPLGSSGILGAVVDESGAPSAASKGRWGPRRSGALVCGVAALALAVVLGLRWKAHRQVTLQLARAAAARVLDPATRFYVPPSDNPAVQQIASLAGSGAVREAALVTAMEAVPRAVWFDRGSPEEVEARVRMTIMHATHDGGLPVLLAYNLPFRDCAQFSAGGARDGDAYRSWIDAFARGIGNQPVIVILEPDSLGIIPNGRTLDGTIGWCQPTVADESGRPMPAAGAAEEERYALIGAALDRLTGAAPNALVYLDGTHSAWLPVGEIAYRLARAGVARVQGFALNVSNFQPLAETIAYGTFISKCLRYASGGDDQATRFRSCAGPRRSVEPDGAVDWSSAERWYAEHVDQLVPGDLEARRTHFVIDTSRNGRGPLEAARYALAPFQQPPEVIAKLRAGDWCNPRGAGLGPRPAARTGHPLVDAYLWVKPPGESDGSCDSAAGPRAWDYARYNPWGIAAEAQKHFDPLWGMVDPKIGEWFPEQALELARAAEPPLEEDAPVAVSAGAAERAGGLSASGASPAAPAGASLGARGRTSEHAGSGGRPRGHLTGTH